MLEKDNADITEIARVTKLSKRSIYKFIQVISSSSIRIDDNASTNGE